MNATSTPRDLALIGAGYWGKNLARNFNALGALHTLCDASQETLAGYGAEYGEVRKTSDLEAVWREAAVTKVAIAAPAVLHYELAKAALTAGKDVFVEKPLCLEEAQARELVALAEQVGRVLMVGHLLQYHPCIRKLQALVAQGDLGQLHYITSNRLNLGKIRREENALWSVAVPGSSRRHSAACGIVVRFQVVRRIQAGVGTPLRGVRWDRSVRRTDPTCAGQSRRRTLALWFQQGSSKDQARMIEGSTLLGAVFAAMPSGGGPLGSVRPAQLSVGSFCFIHSRGVAARFLKCALRRCGAPAGLSLGRGSRTLSVLCRT